MNRVLSVVLVGAASLALAEGAGGLVWNPPKEWQLQAARPMRVATYRIPATKGDAESAELAIFYFGQGQGGGVDANIRRWVGQFQQSDGSPVPGSAARTRKEDREGLVLTTVDVAGTYTGGAMMGPSAPRQGYRLLGAIVEGPEGAIFFKLTGPERTVGGAERSFRKMLESVRRTR